MIFPSHNVLVIGDTILDHDVYGECVGVSLETPTLKARFKEEKVTHGGAANVTQNLLALGAKVTFFTGVGPDRYTDFLTNWSHKKLTLVPIEYSGRNLVKSRTWITRGDRTYKYLQMNSGDRCPLPPQSVEEIKEYVVETKPDTVVMVDYQNGIFDSEEDIQDLIGFIKARGSVVICGSQISGGANRYSYFRGADYICMNRDEALQTCEGFTENLPGMVALTDKLKSSVVVTLGSSGAILYTRLPIPMLTTHGGYPVEVTDTCGAGDAFLAAFALCHKERELDFCNKWAAASTQQIGTNAPSLEEVLSWQ
jgi:D-beta-D-heptose 7-phosphate kinase/D-beta-D-heptose 1-phosphate adenosyltransferase